MPNQVLNAIDLDALVVLIECMLTTPRLSDDEVSALHRPYSRRIILEMLKTGKNWGEVSGGALEFLQKPEAASYLKSIDNDLGAQVDIVAKSFAEFLDHGEIPAPHYPWRICVMLQRTAQRDLERQFLQAWSRHFSGRGVGHRYVQLAERLAETACPQDASSGSV